MGFFEVTNCDLKKQSWRQALRPLCFYIEKNDKRVNDIIIALNNLIEQPPKIKKIGFSTD